MLIVANFDAEFEMARALGLRPTKLARPIRDALGALGVLLAGFARTGDPVWTMAAVGEDRIAPAVRDTGAVFVSGDLPATNSALPWAWTDSLSALFSGPAPAMVARANHKRLAFELRKPLGCTLPGSEIATDFDHLMAVLDAWPHPKPWVVKAPVAASGRKRMRWHGPVDTDALRARLRNLVERFGEVIVEPWLTRTADYGCCGVVGPQGVTVLPPHEQAVDGHGVFRSITLRPGVDARVRVAARVAGERLGELGYRGPFAIDAFEYETGNGRALCSLCEINARLSFGWVTWAWALRLGHRPWTEPVTLSVSRESAPPADATALLLAGKSDPTAAWIR